MRRHTDFLIALTILLGCLSMFAGCTPDEMPATDATDAPASTANAPVAESEVEMLPPTAEVTATSESPVPETTPDSAAPTNTPLPEVRGVNTAQLSEIVQGTVGKVTVLNIWATWCGPCVHEMPDLVRFYNETDRDSIAFVSLSIDAEPEITGAIPEFQRTHKVPFPIYVLTERDDEGLAKALRGTFEGAIPATFLYDATGKLVESVTGAITLAELQAKVKSIQHPSS